MAVLLDADEVLVPDYGDDVDYRELEEGGEEEGEEGWCPFRED